MEFYQQHRHTIGIFLVCFLLNDKSLAQNVAREQNVNESKATIEPEGKTAIKISVENCYFFFHYLLFIFFLQFDRQQDKWCYTVCDVIQMLCIYQTIDHNEYNKNV